MFSIEQSLFFTLFKIQIKFKHCFLVTEIWFIVNIFKIKIAMCRMKVLNRFDSLKSIGKTDGMVIYNIFKNNQSSQVNFIERRFIGSLLESQWKHN